MVDIVSTQIIEDGDRNAIFLFTNRSDGTGEANVVKVRVADLSPLSSNGRPCTSVNIEKVQATVFRSTGDQEARLFIGEESTNGELVLSFASSSTSNFCFKHFGGIPNSRQPGWTGNLVFSTGSFTLGSGYTVLLEVRKNYS